MRSTEVISHRKRLVVFLTCTYSTLQTEFSIQNYIPGTDSKPLIVELWRRVSPDQVCQSATVVLIVPPVLF